MESAKTVMKMFPSLVRKVIFSPKRIVNVFWILVVRVLTKKNVRKIQTAIRSAEAGLVAARLAKLG